MWRGTWFEPIRMSHRQDSHWLKCLWPWWCQPCICLCLSTGLYGDDGLIPVRLLMPKVQRPLLEQFQSSPSLLWLAPSLGLEPQHALELICVLGVVLSLGAVLLGLLRDSLIYLCLWALYLSIYNVSTDIFGAIESSWSHVALCLSMLEIIKAFKCFWP